MNETGSFDRIQHKAEEVFEDRGKAQAWLREPLSILGGKAPLQLSETTAGAEIVEQMLAKLAWGGAA
jgi:putative toxin-antitoxin system antitoxin component (TIGR02293 family)